MATTLKFNPRTLAALASTVLISVSCNTRGPGISSTSAAPVTNASTQKQVSGEIAPQGTVFSWADTVDRVGPAVVTVRSARRIRAPQQFQFGEDPFFDWLFGGGQGPRRNGREQPAPSTEEQALGSGVIVRAEGYILTNDHVVDGAEDISVDLVDRRSFKAKLVGADKPSDLAVLKIDARNLPVLQPGDSDKVRVGDICLAVGNPLGIGETVTAGIISAKGRQTGLSDGSFQDFLQTDAPINQGNSGGPLVNTRAELIGINSRIISPNGGGNIGIGFAIPSNMAKTVLTQLIAHGKVSRGMLGVTVQTITPDLAASLGLKDVQGVLVSGVTPGGAADRAGIKTGDVILDLNGAPVNDVNTLRNRVAESGAGANAAITTLRNGNRQQLHVKLGEFRGDTSAAEQNGPGGGEPYSENRLGVELTTGSQGLTVTSVNPGSPAQNAGLQTGDVIVQINRQPVHKTDDVKSALAKSGDRPALLQILRNGQTIFVPVRLS